MTIWLKTNTRALALGMLLPLLLAAVGLLMALSLEQSLLQAAGWALTAVSVGLLLMLAWQMRQPRLAYEPGNLLVYVRSGGPTRVPLEIVEGFLLGQAPSMLSGRQHERTEAASVVIRLSEKATEWARGDIKPALGKWCDGYITLRGTWCEPLSVDVVNRLNAQLDQASRELRQAQVKS